MLVKKKLDREYDILIMFIQRCELGNLETEKGHCWFEGLEGLRR